MNFNTLPNQAMERGMDALWLKMQVTADNIANYETPGYKAKQVTFEQVLRSVNPENASDNNKTVAFRTRISADKSTEARVDGNNVVMEKEQLELWKEQVQYAALAQKITGSYSNIKNIVTQLSR
ncbi:MAG: flagellar basal body rod protein FlgB [Hydrogenoanaerobacterium sp.]